MVFHIPYVYRLTDKVNGKRYIGSRYAKMCDPAELGVKYFTSRPEVAALFKANPNRFEKQIIVTGTKEYVIKVEKNLIDFSNAVMSDGFYNRTNNRAIHPDDCAKGSSKVGKVWGPIISSKQKTAKTGLYGMTKSQRTAAAIAGGKAGGEANRVSGHMSALGKKFCGFGGKVGGKVAGKLSKISGAIYAIARNNNAQRYICTQCSLESTPSGIGRHHQVSKHFGRKRVK